MDITLIIDNYDSFVYNIAQIVAELGSLPLIIRNDEISVNGIERLNIDRIIISPGPGTPENIEDVGIAVDVVKRFANRVPILGICLGHQVIGYVFGAKIKKAKTVMHGKIDRIMIVGESPIFKGIPKIFKATRYNSLVIDNPPPTLIVDATSLTDNEIMAIHHMEYPIYGVQFHPESVGSQYGREILKNFLDMV